MDDRDIEALREVARVAGRPPLHRVGREADLVVRDQVERPADGVPVECGEVQRFRDTTLPGKRRVAVDQDGERDARVVQPHRRRAIGLFGAGAALDDRIDRLEMAGVRSERDGDVADRRRTRSLGAEVVLDVARPSFARGDQGVDRPFTLELADDRVVTKSEGMSEDVQPSAVCHSDHDLVRAALRRKLDGLVEHRDDDVQPLDRELLLAEEGAPQVLLERLDARELGEQLLPFVDRERPSVPAGLDRLPQPHALLVVGDVLDLVRDRPAIGLAKPRKRVGERLARDVEAQHGRGDARLQLRRQLRDQALGLERRVSGRLGSEGIETSREMAVHPVRLDQRHRSRNASEELRRRFGRRCDWRSRGRSRRRRHVGGRGMPVPLAVERLEEAVQARVCRDELARPAFEQVPPFGRHRVRVLQVLLEQVARVARVQAVDVHHSVVAAGTTRADDSSRPRPRGRARSTRRRTRWRPSRAGCCDRRSRPRAARG